MAEDNRTDAQKAADAKSATASNAGGGSFAKDNVGRAAGMASAGRTGNPQLNEETRARDAELTANRSGNVTTNNPKAPENVARQHEKVDAELARRSEQNRPGHEKNMERAEAEAGEAHARTDNADDHRSGHVPTGKQWNRNTPRIDESGAKHWD
jgi:hypothetical protein